MSPNSFVAGVRKLHQRPLLAPALALLLLTACDADDSAPTAPTSPPSTPPPATGAPALTGVSAEPGGAGLQHATEFAFQPVGEAGASPTFAWTFGEGGTSNTGPSVRHVYEQAGTFTVRVEARNNAGTSAATRTVDVRSLTGAWTGTVMGHTHVPAGQARPITTFELTLEQTPTRSIGAVAGEWSDNAGCRQRNLLGQVASPRAVTLSVESLFCNTTDLTLSGELDGSGNVVEGRCPNGGPDCTFRMTRR